MPKLDSSFNETQESTGGDVRRLMPGIYMSRVQAVRTEWTDSRGDHWTSDEKQYVKLILDIDAGEFTGYFTDDYWQGEQKDWGHTLYMSWSPRALGMLKHTFSAFDEANKGFDSRAAFEADKWELFIGKRVLVHWGGEEYESNTGAVRLRVRPDRAVTESDNARAKVLQLDNKRVDYADYLPPEQSTSSSPKELYDGVPF